MSRVREASATFAVVVSILVLGVLIGWGALTIEAPSGSTASPNVVVHFAVNSGFVLIALGFALRAHPYSLHIFHLIGVLIFGCVAGLYQYLSGSFPLAGPVMIFRREIPTACLVVSLWLIAYQFGYSARRLGPRGAKASFGMRFLGQPVGIASVHFALIVGLFALVYLGSLGLVGAFTRAAAEESLSVSASGPLYLINVIFVRAIPLLAVAGTALAIRHGGLSLGIGLLIPMFVFELIGVAVTNNPFAAARYWFVAVTVGLAAPHFLAQRRTGVPVLICAVLGLSVLPSIGAARGAETLDEIIQFYLRIDSPFEYLAMSGDVDAFGMMALAIKWLGIHGPTGGIQILGALLFWVPRTLWPSKPIGTGAMVSEQLGYDFTNLSVPIMTEPLVDFGLVGVPFFAFAFGWILSSIDRTYWTAFDPKLSPTGIRRIDVVYPFWVGLMLFLTRGDLLSSFAYTVGITAAMIPFVIVPSGLRSRYLAGDISGSSGTSAIV